VNFRDSAVWTMGPNAGDTANNAYSPEPGYGKLVYDPWAPRPIPG
jgi:hypothetical protein